jgi:uncharacterized Zn finger protein
MDIVGTMSKPDSKRQTAIDARAHELAGATYYARGKAYATDGRVALDIVRSDGVTAIVRGTEDYLGPTR